MKFYSILIIFGVFSLAGCQSFDLATKQPANERKMTSLSENPLAQSSQEFERKLQLMVDDLITSAQFDYQKRPMLVTTFVWLDSLTYKKSLHQPMQQLGHQVSQGVMTYMVQRGANIVEHLAGKSIAVSKNASYYLSRDVNQLSNKAKVDYIIAGTLSKVSQGAIVNAEIIEVSTSKIVGAARQYFDDANLWPNDRLTTVKSGFIYRQQNGG